MSTTAKSYCVSFDINYLWNLSDDELGRCLKDKETGRPLSAAEVRTHLAMLAGRGYDVMPTCENHDARGYCQGHPVEPEPVPLQFCEAHKLVDQLRTTKSLGLANEWGTRVIINLMTRGYIYQPLCNNTDAQGLCLGHPIGQEVTS